MSLLEDLNKLASEWERLRDAYITWVQEHPSNKDEERAGRAGAYGLTAHAVRELIAQYGDTK